MFRAQARHNARQGMCVKPAKQVGFSLIELSIVLIVLGLILKASVEPIGQRIEHQRRLQAHEQLKAVHQHLKAHWVSYAHLPCPVSSQSQRLTSINVCKESSGGLPANSLGIIGPVNPSGALLDPWNRPLSYSVSLTDIDASENPDTPDWLTPSTLATINFTRLQAGLTLCREALEGSCSSASEAAADIVAVVVSTGMRNTEREGDNRDNDQSFISAPFSSARAYAFDDQLIWLGRSELIYLALQSGWLP